MVVVVIMMASMINTIWWQWSWEGRRWQIVALIQTIPGNVQQAEVRGDEEGVRVVHPVRLRDRPHHLLQQQQVVPVRQHRHGQGDDGHNGEKKKTMMNIKRRGLL